MSEGKKPTIRKLKIKRVKIKKIVKSCEILKEDYDKGNLKRNIRKRI